MFPLLVPLLSIALGPEIPLGSTRITSAPYTQSISSVASNGRDFLALWSDQRNSLDVYEQPRFPALYAGRVDASGKPLDPTGRKLFDSALGKLTWTGASYMLVYTTTTPFGSLYAQQLDDDGDLVGQPTLLTVLGPPTALASNGRNVLLITTADTNTINVALLAKDGSVIGRMPISLDRIPQQIFVLPGGDYGFMSIQSSCFGTQCSHEVTLFTVNAVDGTVTTKPLFPVSFWAEVTAAVSDSGNILVAVQQDDQAPPTRLAFYLVVKRDGTVVKPMTILEQGVPQSISGFASPSVGWDGHEFLVIDEWPAPTADAAHLEMHGFRVTADGVLLDPTPLPLNETVSGYPNPAQILASSAAGQLSAWNRDTDVFVRAAKTFDDLASAPPHDITLAPALQRFPKIASGGVAVWTEDFDMPAVHASAIGSRDTQLLAPVVPEVAVAKGKTSYLVVSRTSSPFQIIGRRLDTNGAPLGDPFVIGSETGENLGIAFNGRDAFLVTWTDDNQELHAARVSESGSVLDPSTLTISDYGSAARAIATGSGWLVVWIDLHFCGCLISPPPPPTSTFYAAAVSDSGTVGPANEILNAGSTGSLVLARAGANQIAALWRDLTDTPNYTCLNRMLLHDDGSIASSVEPIVCRAGGVYNGGIGDVDAATDGSKLLVVWQELPAHTITALRIDPLTLTSLDAPVKVNPPGTLATAPSVVSNGDGVTIAYQRIDDVSRVFARNLQMTMTPRRRVTPH